MAMAEKKAKPEHLKGNLKEKYPAMAEKEWYGPFNRVLGLDPGEMACSSTKDVYWQCAQCGNVYRMSPRDRANRKYRNQESCYYCRGLRQMHPFTV